MDADQAFSSPLTGTRNMNQVAVRVWLVPGDAEIDAWTLGLEYWQKNCLSQKEWAEMSLPEMYTPEDWYGTHEDLDPSKCYELYLEGAMRGSVDHNGEADEEFDWVSIDFREMSREEMKATGLIYPPEEEQST